MATKTRKHETELVEVGFRDGEAKSHGKSGIRGLKPVLHPFAFILQPFGMAAPSRKTRSEYFHWCDGRVLCPRKGPGGEMKFRRVAVGLGRILPLTCCLLLVGAVATSKAENGLDVVVGAKRITNPWPFGSPTLERLARERSFELTTPSNTSAETTRSTSTTTSISKSRDSSLTEPR